MPCDPAALAGGAAGMRRVTGMRHSTAAVLAVAALLALPQTRQPTIGVAADLVGVGIAAAKTSPVAPQPGVGVKVPAGCRALTDRQLASLVAAHWPRGQRRTAFAVALAESGGRTCAVGDVGLQTAKWGPSVCLWQIRSARTETGTGRVRDQAANLRSATTCAAHARALQRTAGWQPWSTWIHGSYRPYLPRAARAGL